MTNSQFLSRSELLLGSDVMAALAGSRVILFGVGGVGSWCAEALVRTGIRRLTLVDSDWVGPTNLNRQLMATTRTLGQPKVEALKARLLEIAPDACITALQKEYSDGNCGEFRLDSYDYIIDAIDSLKDKASLILRATATDAVFFSSMGAALKVDPSQVRTAEFWNVRGCPLGAALRKKYKREHTYPGHKFRCVYSEEMLANRGEGGNIETDPRKACTNGSLAHVTAIFGMTLAGLVVRDLYRKTLHQEPDFPDTDNKNQNI